MPSSRNFILLLGCAALLCMPLDSDARRRKSKQTGPKLADVVDQVRTTYEELITNSNPKVRRTVFEGQLELGKKDYAAAMARGIEEKDWAIQGPAIKAALKGRDRKLKKKADAILMKLLESGEAEERERGVATLRLVHKKKLQIKKLKAVAKTGSKDARHGARALLIKEGGSTAWAVIKAGLKEQPSEPEYAQAIEALKSFDNVIAYSWALKRLHGVDSLATLARDYLVRVDSKRVNSSLIKKLKKQYHKLNNSDAEGAFQARLRLAYILALRGHVGMVKQTLLAAFNPNYRPPAGFTGFKVMAWKGLQRLRDGSVLRKQLSARYKLNMRDLFLNNDNAEEVDAAYTWLENWVKANADPKVIKLLQEATRSERPVIRVRAMGALANIGHRPSVVIFERAIMEGRPDIRLAAAKALAAVAKVGDEARFAQFLRVPNMGPEAKLALVKGLGRIGSTDSAKRLQMLIYDSDKRVKMAVASALSRNGSPVTRAPLKIMKRSPDHDVRFEVWKGLLVKPSDDVVKEFKQGAVSWLTAKHVRYLGADKRVPVDLISYVAENGTDQQRPVAIEVLRERGESAATRLLTVYETSKSEETASAGLLALADLRGAASVSTYRKALGHRFGGVRAAGYVAIRQHGPRALLETVLKGLGDNDPLARAHAARTAVSLAKKK